MTGELVTVAEETYETGSRRLDGFAGSATHVLEPNGERSLCRELVTSEWSPARAETLQIARREVNCWECSRELDRL